MFVAATIAYNVVEAVVALAAGSTAGSTALIGFGLDSVIEVASATGVAWQFAGRDPERRERAALRVIAVSFFALAAYVSVESVLSLVQRERLFGWWWADPTAALVIAAVAVKEGREAWRGRHC